MLSYVEQMWSQALAGDKQGGLFFIVLYCFFILGYSVIYQLRVRAWSKVQGTLIDSDVSLFDGRRVVISDQNYLATALYTYSVDGKEYSGKRVSPWLIIASYNAKFVLHAQLRGIQRHVDGSVDVFYNPNKPEKSFLIKPGLVGLCITLAISIVSIFIYWNAYHR